MLDKKNKHKRLVLIINKLLYKYILLVREKYTGLVSNIVLLFKDMLGMFSLEIHFVANTSFSGKCLFFSHLCCSK